MASRGRGNSQGRKIFVACNFDTLLAKEIFQDNMNELKALVYCSDIIPTEENSTSGGGLRSLQIMDLLRQMKIKVHYLTPEASVTPKERRGFKYLGSYNQKNQGRPNVTIVSLCQYDPAETPLGMLSIHNKIEYTKKHGYDLYVETMTDVSNRKKKRKNKDNLKT